MEKINTNAPGEGIPTPASAVETNDKVATWESIPQKEKFALISALMEKLLSPEERQAFDRTNYKLAFGEITNKLEGNATPSPEQIQDAALEAVVHQNEIAQITKGNSGEFRVLDKNDNLISQGNEKMDVIKDASQKL